MSDGHALVTRMGAALCECGVLLGGYEGTALDWHAQHLAEQVVGSDPTIADLTNERDELRARLAATEIQLRAARSEHVDLVSRLGFDINITEPMADNDTIVGWFAERCFEADEWRESQRWRAECYLAGHPDDEDCFEHDPSRRLEDAETNLAAARMALAEVEVLHREVRTPMNTTDHDALRTAVLAVLRRMEARKVDHRHADEPGAASAFGIDGRAYYYAGDVIDDIYDLRAALGDTREPEAVSEA